MSADLHWSIIRDPATFAALESEWWDLWHRVALATPFESPAWLLPWWDTFAPGELLVLAVRAAGRLVGLAPYYLDSTGPGRALPIGISLSDYHDVLLDGACANPVCESLAARMMACEPRLASWELLELPPHARALCMGVPVGCRDSVEPANACPVLRLPPNADALVDAYPPRKRRALSMARNRAARRGAVEIAEVNDPLSAGATLELLIQLHGARWQDRGEAGVLADSRVREFHRQVVQRAVRAGLLRLCALRIAGAVAAVYYGFAHRERAYGYLTGFDPRYQYESPGTILLAEVMERAIREGAREFHFLRGRETYKYGWGAQDRWNFKRVLRRTEAYARAS